MKTYYVISRQEGELQGVTRFVTRDSVFRAVAWMVQNPIAGAEDEVIDSDDIDAGRIPFPCPMSAETIVDDMFVQIAKADPEARKLAILAARVLGNRNPAFFNAFDDFLSRCDCPSFLDYVLEELP
jgi:hypothetical protein